MLQNKGQVDLQDVIRCKNRSTFTIFFLQILMSRICNMGIFIVCSNLEVKYQPTRKNSLLYKKIQSFHYFHMFHSNVSCFILMIILFMNTSNAIESVYFVDHESNYQMWAKRKDTRNTCDTRLCLHNNEILLTSVSDCRFFFSFKCWSKI